MIKSILSGGLFSSGRRAHALAQFLTATRRQILAAALIGLPPLFASAPAHAFFSPLSINVIPPAQFPPDNFTITGARVSALWGRQRDVWGLDLGLIGNITELSFAGIAVSGIFNVNHGMTTVTGLQLAGVTNINTNKATILGLQVAAFLNSNTAESSLTGLELALVNLSPHTKIYGFQVGLYNQVQDIYGFQIGLVNVANSLHGIQLGLLNYNQTGLLAVSPFLNIGF